MLPTPRRAIRKKSAALVGLEPLLAWLADDLCFCLGHVEAHDHLDFRRVFQKMPLDLLEIVFLVKSKKIIETDADVHKVLCVAMWVIAV